VSPFHRAIARAYDRESSISRCVRALRGPWYTHGCSCDELGSVQCGDDVKQAEGEILAEVERLEAKPCEL